ncbi:hypothetical protein [Parolsenella catena]|jgi:hypothetical protein|uniref:hypothetical protein n=1 Tax=Parolsenella catena TaxID=2003188 RepID=UPI00204707D5|nr:MAG TPA: Type 4 fimbrial biogenesis protein PilY2 [Caudoviricetes sp.]
MSDELISAMRRYGAAMADATANDPPGRQACYGTVESVSGASMTVSVKGAALKLPYTTACSGARAGDRCIVQSIGPTAVVTGIIDR